MPTDLTVRIYMTLKPSSNGLDALIQQLNPPQREAVLTSRGPLLILAGAGSGKTRVLTFRMAALITQGHAAPDEILAVTFTNKAAREMEARIFKILSEMGISLRENLWVSTFHSFCVRVLRQHIHLLDYQPYFAIYDDSDQLSQIKKVMNSLNISDKIHPAKSFRNRINTAKMLGLDPQQAEKSPKVFFDQKTIEVYKAYEFEMKKANAVDFGDLLMKVYELFRMYPEILEQYQDKFKYIMVDEYQDTNHIQYLLVQQLAQKTRNLCVVGDEDQSIYSWRGADIQNILDFEKDFPEAKVVKLEENYRSTGTIVKAATAVIKNNSQRKDKTLFTSNSDGELITVREERTEYDEAKFVVRKIRELLAQGSADCQEMAIFYRTNAQSRVLEEQLRTSGLPYKIVGGVRFYERLEIKDVLGYLKLTINSKDDVAFKRVINVPARGIGKTTVEKLEELSVQEKISLTEATEKAIDQRLFNSGTTTKLRTFLNLMDDLRGLSKQHNLVDFYTLVLERSEYALKLKTEDSPEANARIENLEELSNAMTQFMKERPDHSLQAFLEEMALVSDIDSLDETVNSVTLMTLHVSKGLEYPYVWIVGLEENLFPSGMAAEDEDGDHSIEEERRLAYVGMTRARQKLTLTYARSRKVWGQEQYNQPSRFLKEIPKQYTEFSTALEQNSFVSRLAGASSFGKTTPSTGSFQSKVRSESEDYDTQEFPDYEDESSFSKGQKVRHPTFGVGSIFQTEGSGEQQKVSVLFADQTIKKFVAKYARLERIR
ncbi:MAG: ATP-dependent helicase [Pseudobdellovibrionaceae bacterium]